MSAARTDEEVETATVPHVWRTVSRSKCIGPWRCRARIERAATPARPSSTSLGGEGRFRPAHDARHEEERRVIAEIERNLEAIRALCQEFGVAWLEVFGSAATGAFDPERSDIDFIIEYPPDYEFGHWLKRYFELKTRFEALFGRSVDLVMVEAMQKRHFIESANESRRLLYAARLVGSARRHPRRGTVHRRRYDRHDPTKRTLRRGFAAGCAVDPFNLMPMRLAKRGGKVSLAVLDFSSHAITVR